jgi:hypothetical protein
MRTVRRRIYAAHLTVCRGIIEQLEQVEIDAFPTAFVTKPRPRAEVNSCSTTLVDFRWDGIPQFMTTVCKCGAI